MMRTRIFHLFCFTVCLAVPSFALVQEGHPLTGTWSGDWGPAATQRNHLTIVMNWDGKNVTGMINPGPDAIPLGSVFLDVTNWTIRIEADTNRQRKERFFDEDSFGTRSLLRPSHAFLSSSAAAIQWCRHCGGASAAVAGRPCEPRIDGRQKGYWEVRPGLSGLPRAADVPFQPWARALYQYRTSR